MIDESLIGKRVKRIREEKKMTQANLAAATQISITQISGYENGKVPSLTNLAKISRALDVTLDRLYFGDESESLASAASDDGRLIVNCLAHLYSLGVVTEFAYLDPNKYERYFNEPPYPYMLKLEKHQIAIKRLMGNFNEVLDNISTYEDPAEYLKQVKDSVANEINQR